MNKTAIIIGAGPAGLTAAYELLKRTKIKPIIFEATNDIGGIAKTSNYKGNRIDLGGHRFFSKSERVMAWWQNIFQIQGKPALDEILLKENTAFKYQITANGPDPEKVDNTMLLRRRISRIFFLRKFFNYPLTLNFPTLKNLGALRIIKITLSYMRAVLFPIKSEQSLEDFFINRFGKELYQTFFKDYTEKVWGVTCKEIKPEWGTQRIKGLSITKALVHALKKTFSKRDWSLQQKNIESSLVENFIYPKFGPGQFWEEVAKQIINLGGEIHKNCTVVSLENCDNKIISATIKNSNSCECITGDYFFSTMPIKDLINGFKNNVPHDVLNIANQLKYRDFITVGLLLNKLKIKNTTRIKTLNDLVPDNWIYIQEREVKIGRLQIFNNWSPYLVKDLNTVWLGLEYFCNEGDQLWVMPNEKFIKLAISEVVKISVIDESDVIDSVVFKTIKAYPAYFGTYAHFDKIKNYLQSFTNLFSIGRNGMHRYNNMDHSMLTAMVAVDNIVDGVKSTDNIWSINTEADYLEKGQE